MKITDQFVFFFSYKDIFSNHYVQPFVMTPPGGSSLTFKTVEHYMMWTKAVTFGDTTTADKILEVKNPNEAKKLGRGVVNYDDKVWSSIRAGIVTQALVARLHNNSDLQSLAIEHREAGRRFVEASPYDKLWGIGLAETDEKALDEMSWPGKNLLGQCWEQAITQYLSQKGVINEA